MRIPSIRHRHLLPLFLNNLMPLAVYAFAMMLMISLYWLFTLSSISVFRIVFHAQWMLLIIIGGTGIVEQNEEKNGGYEFLRALPVGNTDIIAAKWLSVFLTAGFILIVQFLLLTLSRGPRDLLALGRVLVLLAGLASLLLTALFYLIIFRFGLARFVKLAWLLAFGAMALPILITELIILPRDLDLSSIHRFLITVPVPLWILATLAIAGVYILLGRAAVRIKAAADFRLC